MFPHVNSPWQRALLLGLGLIWAGLLFGGFLFSSLDETTGRRLPTWARMTSSLTLVLAAWTWCWAVRHGPTVGFGVGIALGMTLGWIGDLCLARLVQLPQPLLLGMAAFGLGHMAYITAAVCFGNQHGLANPAARWGAWAGWLLIGLVGWYGLVLRGQQPTVHHWAALPYALLLASTAGCATGLFLQRLPFASFALGAALFLLSDLILAAHLFNHAQFARVHIQDVVWLTYGPGQFLIVYAVGSALHVAATSSPR